MQRALFAATVLTAALAFGLAQAAITAAPGAPPRSAAPAPAKAPVTAPATAAAAPATVPAPAKVAVAPTSRCVVHRCRCHCHVLRVHTTARRDWRRHVHLARFTHARGRGDTGVAPTQAWVYRQELAGHGLASANQPFRRGWRANPPTPAYARSGVFQGRYQTPPPAAAYAQSGGGQRETWVVRQGGGAPRCCNSGYRSERRVVYEGRGWADTGYRQARYGVYQPAWRRAQGGGYEVYGYAGRDANGYLVWANKPR